MRVGRNNIVLQSLRWLVQEYASFSTHKSHELSDYEHASSRELS